MMRNIEQRQKGFRKVKPVGIALIDGMTYAARSIRCRQHGT